MMLYFMRYSSNFGLGLLALMVVREALDFLLELPIGGLINPYYCPNLGSFNRVRGSRVQRADLRRW